jgi:hypothetical protein
MIARAAMPPITGPAIHAFEDDDEDDDDELLEVLDPEPDSATSLVPEVIAAYVAEARFDTVFVVFCR